MKSSRESTLPHCFKQDFPDSAGRVENPATGKNSCPTFVSAAFGTGAASFLVLDPEFFAARKEKEEQQLGNEQLSFGCGWAVHVGQLFKLLAGFKPAIGAWILPAIHVALLQTCILVAADPNPFIVKPYLQLGDAPKLRQQEQMMILWHTADQSADWKVEYRDGADGAWKKVHVSHLRTVRAKSIESHRIYAAKLDNLTPGATYQYRVLLDNKQIFDSQLLARKSVGTAFRFAVSGDVAQGTPDQKAIANQLYKQKPDFFAIAGDIVYGRGLISEYRTKYFPIYNSDAANPATGAPLLRSTLFLAAPGNHDVAGADLEKNPDGLAYFLYWAQPLNGPLGTVNHLGSPILQGATVDTNLFRKAADKQFPRMANFSFDYADSHWTVIDSNKYADWSQPELMKWLKKDLADAEKSAWRFVLFHHPGFNSSKAHFEDQWMRLLAPVFEQGKVSVVFAGHVHNYQRSFPLTFQSDLPTWRGKVDGKWNLDKNFNGATVTKANGVIYLVTGAGGAKLYNPEQQNDPKTWQGFTNKFVSTTHSFTLVDATADKLQFRQISQEGQEVDKFTLTR